MMTCGPEIVILSPGARVMPVLTVGGIMPVLTVGGSSTASMSVEASAGDMFVGDDAASVWDGTAWLDIGHSRIQDGGVALFDHRSGTVKHLEPQPPDERPCPYCGTLNPFSAVECGAGRWNGCGAPLRRQ